MSAARDKTIDRVAKAGERVGAQEAARRIRRAHIAANPHMSDNALARDLRCKANTVRTDRLALGIPPARGVGKLPVGMPPDAEPRIRAMRDENRTWQDIAGAFGVSRTCVINWANARGIQTKREPRPADPASENARKQGRGARSREPLGRFACLDIINAGLKSLEGAESPKP